MHQTTTPYTRTELFRYFLKPGTVGFGGPPALVSGQNSESLPINQVVATPFLADRLLLPEGGTLVETCLT